MAKATSMIFHNMDDISGDDRNAILVILGLLLIATYQATLSPPSGVWQGENTTGSYDATVVGKSVMSEITFLLLYIPTYVVFIVAFFLTLALLKPFPRGFRNALQVLLAFLAICFDQSISFISPTDLSSLILNMFSVVIFILTVFMFVEYRVSMLSSRSWDVGYPSMLVIPFSV
ncbi:Ankyrin repeat family protein [Hibiscus syriacus]|uniref:Ankyrin repeat family protein n=1 Tax=Hibiscus syriacus TaxID=106335 RepID=A0A6A2Y0S9_HIBSY|nr:Ankyrin repeat family protein [Hibiscus syriacus]